MKLPPVSFGKLKRRYKRFLVDILTKDGEELTIYSPNTGKMTACSEPNSEIAYSDSMSLTRKLRYTLELVKNKNGWVGVRPDLANALVKEAIEKHQIPELVGYQQLKTEVPYGTSSRIDLLLTEHPILPNCYIEVKSATWVAVDGCYAFPDAPSSRAAKQLREMVELKHQGLRVVVFYLVQCSGGNQVRVAHEIDPHYAEMVKLAKQNGVEFLAWHCKVTPEEICLNAPLKVID